MATQYPPMPGPPPQIFTHEHVAGWERELQNLAVADWILQKAERAGVPVEATRRDCDALCQFFQRMIAEETGQQASNPLPRV